MFLSPPAQCKYSININVRNFFTAKMIHFQTIKLRNFFNLVTDTPDSLMRAGEARVGLPENEHVCVRACCP